MATNTFKTHRKTRRLSTLLRELARTYPKSAAHLSKAQSNREVRLLWYLEGPRVKGYLRGYEELIEHLEELEQVFEKSRRLRNISFLIGRARDDFHTSLEAALSGYHSVAGDAMRDVMEIELLLREFYYEPKHIEDWVSFKHKDRMRKFRPS